MWITVIRGNDTRAICDKLSPPEKGKTTLACSQRRLADCLIYLFPDAEHWVWGEELQHCIDAWSHKS